MHSKLKKIREQIGLTQVQVAEKAGISERQYIRIELNEHEPRAGTAAKIARTVNSTVEELWGGNPKEEKPDGNRASEGTYKI